MNFLAHLYLSGNSDELKIGNFIADSVKGRGFAAFSQEIQHGIILHRAIDMYTDDHPIVRQSIGRLRPKYKKYSGVLVDIFYDHYLALNWNEFHSKSLDTYTQDVYQLLNSRLAELPDRTQMMLPYMIQGNWLLNYQYFDGIGRVLGGMSRRTKFDSGMEKGVHDLKEHYDDFENEFRQFMPDISAFVSNFIEEEKWTKF